MSQAIEISNLSKTYPKFKLQDVSFTVPSGCVMGLVGENGAGKTTVIKLILDMIRKDGGSIAVFGLDHHHDSVKIKEQTGVVFDEGFFYDDFRPKDISKVMKRFYRTWDEKEYTAYLNRFKLPEEQKIKEYSKGMKVKLKIAVALCHHPKLLILDEPTSGLDPVARAEILDLFADFIQDEQHSILISSHITTDLERIADYITFIHEGKIVLTQTKDELMYGYVLAKCGKEAFSAIAKEDMVRYRKNFYGYEMLMRHPKEMEQKYEGLVFENISIEELMVMLIKGERV